MDEKELLNLRFRIDKINRRIALLLLKRLSIVERVVSIKRKNKMPIYDKAREAQMLFDVDKIVRSAPKKKVLRTVFQSIFRSHRRYQSK